MYALIHANAIRVGPRAWSYAFFREYLIENGLDTTDLPRPDPNGPVYSTAWKVVPVLYSTPAYDSRYEQLAGPTYTFHPDHVEASYSAIDLDLDTAKSQAKQIVTDNRYTVEVSGCPFTFSDSTEVTLYTTREDRGTYVDALIMMSDTASITFKFPGNVFHSVNKAEMAQIVGTGMAWIQGAFDWEAATHTAIDACATMNELREIELRHPAQIT